MSGRNKGFDPLASLFEPPDPDANLIPVEDEGVEPLSPARGAAPTTFTDPMVKRPAEAPQREARGPAFDVPDPSGEVPVLVDPALEEKVALARRLAMQALARQPSASPPPVVPAPAPPPVPAAPTPAAPAPANEAAPAIDREQLARRLAAAAQAAARASNSLASPVPPPPPPTTPGKGASPPKAAAPGKPTTASAKAAAAPARAAAAPARKSSLTDRARQPVNATEAARLASESENKRKKQKDEAASVVRENNLTALVQEIIPHWLPGLGNLVVENAIAVRQRDVLRALWRGHRARFLSQGQLERAVGAAAVLAALESAPEGALVAVHALTQASDYLVWLDLDKRILVAAFPDARSYVAGTN